MSQRVSAPISYKASASTVQSALAAMGSNFVVEVVNNYANPNVGLTWIVTFVTPRGDLPRMIINTTGIISAGVVGSVKTRQNGSEQQLWFNPIPQHLMEIPLSAATQGRVKNNVEVYVTTDSGDTLKAVCDGNGTYNGTGFYAYAKGNESDCLYQYSSNATALIIGVSITQFDVTTNTTVLAITGKGFMGGVTADGVRVSIDNYLCNVTTIYDTYIECGAGSIPWGNYTVQVYIPYNGYAYHAHNETVQFYQDFYSIYPLAGSFAGGQILTIYGRGFRLNATVTLASLGSCAVLSITSTTIQCKVPALSAWPTNQSSSTYNQSYSFGIYVDGWFTSVLFEYSAFKTPSVTSISPSQISSAITTTVTIYGHSLFSGSEVTIGGQICSLLNVTTHVLYCLITRSKAVEPALLQTVVVNVGGMGSAAIANNTWVLPTVARGFYVTRVYPTAGSVYGGDTITIHGFGFFDSTLGNYGVSMVKENFVLNTYQQLLVQLNLPSAPILSINCAIVTISTNSLNCTIPWTTVPSNITDYEAVVTLNGVATTCFFPNSTHCTYSQTNLSTPYITHASIASQDSAGVSTVRIDGTLLTVDKGAEVWIAGVSCAITSLTSTSIIVHTPSLYAGALPVTVYVAGLGYANPGVNITNSLSIYSVAVSSPTGSMGGGVIMVLKGKGFYGSSNASGCWSNSLAVTSVSNTTRFGPQFWVNQYISCTTTQIISYLPSVSWYTSTALSVNTVNLVVNGVSAVMTTKFTYSPYTTPIITGNSYSGFAGSVISIPVNLVPGSVLNATKITIGSTLCLQQYVQSVSPTPAPSQLPTPRPSAVPTRTPSYEPSPMPSVSPTTSPTMRPSAIPTLIPSAGPTWKAPTPVPSQIPTAAPSPIPTKSPTPIPTKSPLPPTLVPSPKPTPRPSVLPTRLPTPVPSIAVGVSATYSCVIPYLEAGQYSLAVETFPFGMAQIYANTQFSVPMFNSMLFVNSFSPSVVQSSTMGGTSLSIRGKGLASDTQVTVCGLPCTIINASYTRLTCTTPPLISTTAVTAMIAQNITKDLVVTLPSGRTIASYNYFWDYYQAFDNNYKTFYYDFNTNCYIGIALPAGYVAKPYRMRFYPRVQYSSYFGNILFEGSTNGGLSFSTIASGSGAHEAWNFIDATGPAANLWWGRICMLL